MEYFPVINQNMPKLKVLETYNWIPNLNEHSNIKILIPHICTGTKLFAKEPLYFIKILILCFEPKVYHTNLEMKQKIENLIELCVNVEQIFYESSTPNTNHDHYLKMKNWKPIRLEHYRWGNKAEMITKMIP
jgi:hypothetical protein